MAVVVVIGGGIVGCHVAYRFASANMEVFLLEKEKALGEHTSTRNSGVVHGGIYYEPGSLKARFCVRGRHLTYEFLRKHNVPHYKCGKIIVALKAEEISGLERLRASAVENGVENLSLIDQDEVRRYEPRIRCLGGLRSPETGILDMAAYIRTMERTLRALGVTIAKECEVLSIDDDNTVKTTRGELSSDILINAAGLYSDRITQMCGLGGYEIIPYKGDYYNTNEDIINGLVYPVPDTVHSLGVHLTRTMGGETLIGPSVLRVKAKDDYQIRTPREEFENGALAMVPGLDPKRIYPGYSGNRPKLFANGELHLDFLVRRQEKNRIHLLGIESPGLTAAPALAEYVEEMLK